jgi:hypothetical protein
MSDKINDMVKKKIMRRIYLIWFFRKITSPVFIEGFVFAAMLFLAVSYISFLNVMRNAFNASSSVFSLPEFFVNSFISADTISKLLLVGIIFMALILSRELLFKKRKTILLPL